MAAINKHSCRQRTQAPAGASAKGAADPGERMEVTIMVDFKSKDEAKIQRQRHDRTPAKGSDFAEEAAPCE